MPRLFDRTRACCALAALVASCLLPAHAQSSSSSSDGAAADGQRPNGPPPGPPPEAIQACSGKSAGASCSFSGREGRAMTGTCAAGGPPRGGPGGSSGSGGSGGNASAPAAGGSAPLACRPEPPGGMQKRSS